MLPEQQEIKQKIHLNLKEIEMLNIKRRTDKLVEVVNQRARKLIGDSPIFELVIDADVYVDFIDQFKGVKVRKLKKTVCSIEYGKTWLNGRRAIIYSKTLFVKFLESLEEYANQLACWKEDDEEVQTYLSLALRFDFLFGMLKSYYQPPNQHASVKPLICTSAFKNRFREKIREWGSFNNDITLNELASKSKELSETYYTHYQQLIEKEKPMSLDNCITDNLQGLNDVNHQSSVFSSECSDLQFTNQFPIENLNQSFNLLNECENLEQTNISLQNEMNQLNKKINELKNMNNQLFFVFPENLFLQQFLDHLSGENDFEIFA